jgi:hypothetical protein
LTRLTRLIQLHALELPPCHTALALLRDAPVLNRVLKVDKDPETLPRVGVIHQHCATFQQVPMALKGHVDRRREKRMPWADELPERLPLYCSQFPLERDPFIAREHDVSCPDGAITVPHSTGNIRNLEPFGLPLAKRATEMLEGREEE